MKRLIIRIGEELEFSKKCCKDDSYNIIQYNYWHGRRCLCEELLKWVKKEGLS